MKCTTQQNLVQLVKRVLVITFVVLLTVPQAALAQAAASDPKKPLIDYSDNDVNYYDRRGNSVCGSGSTSSNDTITKFLQALAAQESGGNPNGPVSSGGAKGKYQYIDSTWRSRAASYPPSGQYPQANLAPEEIQDAVAYIEYSVKFKQFNGDLFKLAVSHFYPAANSNPSLLDVIPPKNVITPRSYAQANFWPKPAQK
jgi:hypothetical protein